jgi:hypothetical protein
MSTHFPVFRYAYSLQSLTHVMLLVPQNPFYIVQAAETAYNAGDIPLSARLFLQGIDLVDGEGTAQVSSTIAPEGVSVRAWYGLRVVRCFISIFSKRLGLQSFICYLHVPVCKSYAERRETCHDLAYENSRARASQVSRYPCERTTGGGRCGGVPEDAG